MIKYLKKTLRQYLLYTGANFRSALEIRATFFAEVIGMMFNNIAFVIIWIFFFNTVGSINSWTAVEAIGLEGMVAIAYGIAYALAGGSSELAKDVNNGNFDNFLLSPVNLYVRIIVSYSKLSAFGDILYGIILLSIFAVLIKMSAIQFVVLLLLIPAAGLLFVNFMMVAALLAFLIPEASEAAANLVELLINPSLYPTGLYNSGMRFFFFIIIPALAIGGVPVEIVRNLDFVQLAVVLALSVFWFLLAYILLKFAIKKYESGNLMGAK